MKNRWVEYIIIPLIAINLFVWADQLNWDFTNLTRLNIMPVLGLIAFSTMWWHFLTGFVARIRPATQKIQRLHTISSYWVLVTIVLHPALLVWYAQDKGYNVTNIISGGPTPDDFYTAFFGSNERFIMLGYLGLIGFLAYDIGRWLRSKQFIKQNWHIVEALSDAAFVAIWVHSLNLGRHLQAGWFRSYWIILGLSGIFFILYRYYYKLTHERTPATT